ncbi:MAG TPA: nitrate- and nitrite sensing domain-containing protein [Pseudonocardiaceae bacterium]|nr:nitrate- and nitrite sensing domain-containing protein [Pseudonocardiaceae bacterium]
MADSKWGRDADQADLDDGSEETDDEARGRTGRWRPSNWRLRWKLAVVLLVPAITALALGGFRVNDQVASLRGYDQANEHVALASTLSSIINGLQGEREEAALYAASNKTVGTVPLVADATNLNGVVTQFRQQVAAASGLDSGTSLAMRTAESALDDLTGLRQAVTSTQYPEMAVIDRYSAVVSTLIHAVQAATLGVTDQRLYAMAVGLDELRSAKEAYSLSNAVLVVAAQEKSFPARGLTEFQTAESTYQVLLTEIESNLAAPGAPTPVGQVAEMPTDQRAVLAQTAVSESQQGKPIDVDPGAVQQAGDNTVNLLHAIEVTNYDQLTSLTNNLASAARTAAIRDAAIIFVALLLAFIITLIVARSVLRALRGLRAGALNIARNRLPQNVQRILADPDPIAASSAAVEPIPVFTADEIGEVARSFDVVHSQALRLAAEQAVLRDNVNAIFVNLSRRSQALVERQLGLIDRLERDEQDPDQLANLFELDHLATRMRRNSESLLVLSGTGLGKRVSRPVPIGELVGAAVSEVEHYARIEAGAAPEVLVLGRVVNDMVHLIAELLDNATTFSDPKTKVSVRIASTKGHELALQVTDRGVGMTEDDLWENNERLANPPEIDVSVTRRMGLYVVGKLAQRHGIKVRLRANEDLDGGTVALIMVPPELLQHDGDEPAAQPMLGGGLPSRGSRPTSSAPSGGGPASAAAGIAGAFGVASRAASRDEPASAFLSNDFAPATAFGDSADESSYGAVSSGPNGSAVFQDFAEPSSFDREPPTFNSDPPAYDSYDRAPSQYDRDQEPAGDNEQPDELEPAEPVSLWEAHTAVDEVEPIIPEPSESPAVEGFSADFLTGASGRLESHEVDAPTERLPIYEAVLSQWFRTDAPGGANAAESADPLPVPALPDALIEAPEPEPAVEEPEYREPATVEQPLPELPVADRDEPAAPPAPAAPSGPKPLPSRVPGKAAREIGAWAKRPEDVPVESAGPALTAAGLTPGLSGLTANANGQPAEPEGEAWRSPADEGWQAAESVLNSRISDTTEAGLPKRVPKAHLVPGSIGSPQQPTDLGDSSGQSGEPGQHAASLSVPPRSPDAVRNRMSSFQQGLRRGRHASVEAYSREASTPSAHRSDDEQE